MLESLFSRKPVMWLVTVSSVEAPMWVNLESSTIEQPFWLDSQFFSILRVWLKLLHMSWLNFPTHLMEPPSPGSHSPLFNCLLFQDSQVLVQLGFLLPKVPALSSHRESLLNLPGFRSMSYLITRSFLGHVLPPTWMQPLPLLMYWLPSQLACKLLLSGPKSVLSTHCSPGEWSIDLSRSLINFIRVN